MPKLRTNPIRDLRQVNDQSGRSTFRLIQVCVLAGFVMLVCPQPAAAYVGPGAGFAAIGSLLVMFLAMLSAIGTLMTWPFRFLLRFIRGTRAYARSRIRRFVVLGLDGMEPTLAERFMAEGKLPNLSRLREKGCYRRLGTTLPPLSPVAWSTFLTCSNPGKHNIYDFLSRDRRTYLPLLSSVQIRGPRRQLKLGRWRIPLGKPDIRLLRKGKPFWNVLGAHGIFSSVIRVPITFPPERFRGVLLSAMCVPDLRGTQGTFSLDRTRAGANDDGTGSMEYGGGEQFHVERDGNMISATLLGPDNPLDANGEVMRCPFQVIVHETNGEATLKVSGQTHRLRKGVYSDWISVAFKTGLGIKVRGICQFLLLRTSPEFELYVTPVQIDPEKPAMPISHPLTYATYLAKRQGPYATLGLAEDTWGLNAMVLDDEGFLDQCIQADREREVMFFDALSKVRSGLCVCVFDGVDRIQHMFWRYLDEGHPAHAGQGPRQNRDAIEQLYKRMDDLVGRTMAQCSDDDTVLMVISDHGFKTFRYGIDLNRWLEENGYLKTQPDQRDSKYLRGIDWSQTRAYAMGLAGLYLNIKGREAHGIVEPGEEADRLAEELADKLGGLSDPVRNSRAVNRVYCTAKVYRGPYKDQAPDLIVGYNEGYRVSWDCAIGRVTEQVLHDNTKAWSGDHCVDPAIVPGVLFCNRRIETEHPRLMDIGATILDLFGVPVPTHMDGRPLAVQNGNGQPRSEAAREHKS